jgi:DMSO/TMAO reductase YedYZ molybdopterin-dependent catalytic subunit
MNGEPLSPQHGAPLRLVVPGWYGMASVKWLRTITVAAEPFEGYQMMHSYRVKRSEDEAGEPVRRIVPRALMEPVGIPDFATRERHVTAGVPVPLAGRAWSGHGPVVRIEVSGDDGATWTDAEVDPAPGPHAWHRWRASWTPATPGEVVLACRATDAAGNVQPLDPPWNWGGYMNNAVQRMPVVVDPA